MLVGMIGLRMLTPGSPEAEIPNSENGRLEQAKGEANECMFTEMSPHTF